MRFAALFAKNKSEASILPRGSRGAPHALACMRACTTWLPLQCAVLLNAQSVCVRLLWKYRCAKLEVRLRLSGMHACLPL